MRGPLIAAALLLVATGCNRPRWDRPDEAYRAFSAAVRRGELKAAWEGLSADTRKAMEARAKAVSAASEGSVKDEPMLMFFASGYKPLPQGELKVATEEGQSAVVEVAIGDGGVTQSQKMIKEGDRWAVDLTEAFK
jgi:hypothetical protein